MTQRTTLSHLFVLCILLASMLPFVARAQTPSELTVTPVVIDEKAKARDILKETLTVTNTGKRKLELYPSVNDVKSQDGQHPFVEAQGGAERSDSLANWIEISRGVVELNPGESKDLPFVIRVNLNALPNTYHADISFYEGSNRADAEAKSPLAVVTVNTEVQADIKLALQLNKFVTDSFFFSGDDVLFNYQLQNIGNQELKPKGEIRIYDRKGREVASVPVNVDGRSVTPDQAAQLASAWTAAQGFGKFKAFLNVDYGQSGTLQDTVFFWIIPWQQLLIIFIVSLIAIIVSALYFHRWLEHKHMQRFAMAGMGAGALPAPTGMLVAPPQKLITAIIPEKPKAPKKGFFARFRRAKKLAPESVAEMSAPVVQPSPALQSAARIDTPMRAAPAPAPAHTIDLSGTTRAAAPIRREPGHVINLKDHS